MALRPGSGVSLHLIQGPPLGDANPPLLDSSNHLRIEINANNRELNCCGPSFTPKGCLVDAKSERSGEKPLHASPRLVSVAAGHPGKGDPASVRDPLENQ